VFFDLLMGNAWVASRCRMRQVREQQLTSNSVAMSQGASTLCAFCLLEGL